ncbi:hypothetical protein [Escherichia coli]|uniref:hypothetical protein n=1 Tax=Escherichia coli TaxID=562 RepID=UPI00107C8FBC|nr:hypothetical protein [Escherichia coli]EAB8367046.1 hypothetical protein [Salmonella enterica subsp. enterica]EAT5091898.1 hypothetical protein [Salmonella enterica]EEZ8953165.1 hypothetical protein [Escherichia coli O35]EHK6581264.1 hypothetical protein [Escherichia albertii]EJY2430517.1 hypothetical protein [Salmonella enterica subsp. enterica serovar Infantis]
MATFTKEQLIAHIRERKEARQRMLDTVTINPGFREYLERELATDEIALASLASAPVAWLVGGRLFTTEIAARMYASEVRKAVKPLFFSALL